MTVKLGADWELEKMARDFLGMNDPEEPVRHQAELDSETIREVSLKVANKIQVNIMEVVDNDLDLSGLWDIYLDAEQFLVSGKVQQIGGENYYRQGIYDDLDGKMTKRKDEWLDSLD